jgi:uncharacterized protein (TIGR01319 family)
MGCYLLVDFGSTFTKLTAVDLEKEDIIGTSKAMTTVETNIIEGYQYALANLYQQIGKTILFDKIVACSSAAGGLKMAAIGLVEELTTEAAKRVCLGAGAKVDLVLSHHINNQELQQILDKKIDIILLAGGANGGNSECVIHNAQKLAESNITAPIVFAGNKDASDEIIRILSAAQKTFFICENVMPKLNVLNINDARDRIKDIFVKNIIEAKGIKKVEAIIDRVILPTPHAVLVAAELLSKGFDDEKGLGDIMLADVGGATTDIYSIADGLPTHMNAMLTGLEEPFAKRTVEGDLGMRYSSLGILQSMTPSDIAHYGHQQLDIEKECIHRHEHVDFIPESDHDFIVEDVLAKRCIDVAVKRHVGHLTSVYTPMGMMYHQTGKDLTNVSSFIGTGGAVIAHRDPKTLLQEALSSDQKAMELRPKHPDYYIDQDYILSAMGLLSIDYPMIALRIMKKRIIKL